MLIQDMCNLNTCAYKNKMHYSGYCFIIWEKNSVKVGSMLCNNCAYVVYFSVRLWVGHKKGDKEGPSSALS